MYVVDQETSAAGTPHGRPPRLQGRHQTASTAPSSPAPSRSPPCFRSAASLQAPSPAGVAVEPRGVYTYITDSATNVVYAYQNTNGTLQALRNSPYAAGMFPARHYGRPARHVRVRRQFRLQHGQRVQHRLRRRPSPPAARSRWRPGPTCVTIEPRAWRLPFHLQPRGQFRLRRAARPAQRLVEAGTRLAVHRAVAAQLRGRRRQRSARFADRSVSPCINGKAPHHAGLCLRPEPCDARLLPGKLPAGFQKLRRHVLFRQRNANDLRRAFFPHSGSRCCRSGPWPCSRG